MNLQLDALRAAGIPDNRIFEEKLSGKTLKRPVLERVRKVMRAGDALVVWRLDRIGRNVGEVVVFVENLAKDEILFRSLSEDINLTTPMGKFMLALMAGLAQFERDMTAARTSAGMASARARGVKMGPKHRILDCPKRLERFKELWALGYAGPSGTWSANDVWADVNAVEGSKLPPMKAQTSYSNWKAKGFPGFDQTTMERV